MNPPRRSSELPEDRGRTRAGDRPARGRPCRAAGATQEFHRLGAWWVEWVGARAGTTVFWPTAGQQHEQLHITVLAGAPVPRENTQECEQRAWRQNCVASLIGWRTEVRRGVVAMAQGFGVGIASGTQRTTLLIPTLLDRAHGKVAARQRWRNHATSTRHCAAATDSSA